MITVVEGLSDPRFDTLASRTILLNDLPVWTMPAVYSR